MASKRLREGEKVTFPAERLALVLESTKRSVELADRIVRRFSFKAGCTEQQQSAISLAVREVVANAVFHGNAGEAAKKVSLIMEMRDGGIVICVRDEGSGFDPASLPDPRDPANLLLDHGRGVFLVNASMDEVTMRRLDSCGMEVTMVKYL
jgi:serine/threonine-protein kinase RsbW